MPGSSKTLALWVAALLFAAVGAFSLTLESDAQDTLQLYVRTTVLDNFHLYYDTGSGFSAQESTWNIAFPSSGGREERLNFPIPPSVQRLRLQPGERPASLSLVKICLVRSVFVSSCVEGSRLAGYTNDAHQAVLTNTPAELKITATGSAPSFVLDPGLLSALRSGHPVLLAAVRTGLFLTAVLLLFCMLVALLRPLISWFSPDAVLVGAVAALVRILLFRLYQPGTVSDSDWFLRYLQVHIYTEAGSRGLVYPLFTTLFEPNRQALFFAQFFLGTISAVLALVLLRSLKRASPWDIGWALLGTCLPVVIGMEALVLSESLSLFLILAALLSARGLTQRPRFAIAATGLGGWCAVLYHCKPQFGFVIALCAIALAYPRLWPFGGNPGAGGALNRTALFLSPVALLHLLAIALNFTCGNFAGTSSMLGYSLFNHAQQNLTCPAGNSDPRIEFFCNARAALGPDAPTTAVTAWVVFPAIHQLKEPFFLAMRDYQRLSIQLISRHPLKYGQTVARSFIDYWSKEVPMSPALYLNGERGRPVLRGFMRGVLSVERLLRDGIAVLYFALLPAVLIKRAWPPKDRLVMLLILTGVVIGSSLVQAFAESSPENSRYAVPAEPLVWIGCAWSLSLLGARKELVSHGARARLGLLFGTFEIR